MGNSCLHCVYYLAIVGDTETFHTAKRIKVTEKPSGKYSILATTFSQLLYASVI